MKFMGAGILIVTHRRLFTLTETNKQINDKPNKWYRGDKPPLRFFAGRAEIFLGHINNSPYGGGKKWNTQCQKYA